jgi:hypothetical protein
MPESDLTGMANGFLKPFKIYVPNGVALYHMHSLPQVRHFVTPLTEGEEETMKDVNLDDGASAVDG